MHMSDPGTVSPVNTLLSFHLNVFDTLIRFCLVYNTEHGSSSLL